MEICVDREILSLLLTGVMALCYIIGYIGGNNE